MILILNSSLSENEVLRFAYQQEDFRVHTVNNASLAMGILQRDEPDLLVIEDSENMDGFGFIQWLRNNMYKTRFVLISNISTLEHILHGFSLGAEDYICKPYYTQELIIRTRAILRRLGSPERAVRRNTNFSIGNITLLPKDRKVIARGQTVGLTHTETEILRILMENVDHIIGRERLHQEVWHDEDIGTNLVDVNICRLRMKIERNVKNPQYIFTIRHLGYKFKSYNLSMPP